MTNLVQQVGREFFNRKYEGSYFLNDRDKPSIMICAQSDGMVFHREMGGSPDRILVNERVVSADFFTGHESFSTPVLGWRCKSKGRFLSYFSRNNRGYHRGLCASNLAVDHAPVTRWMIQSGNIANDLSDNIKCVLALKPKFTPFSEGIEQMRSGKIVSFAVSGNIAVVVGEEDHFNIFFRQKHAGVVLPDNNIVVNVPILSAYLGDLQ